MFEILTAVGLLLWIAVAVWRVAVYVGDDMLDSWQNDEDFDDELFGEALRAGLLRGLVWPIVEPSRALGSLIYRLAYKRANRAFGASGEQVPEATPRHDITDEIAKIPAEPIKETAAQARLRKQAEKGRAAYESEHEASPT